MRAAERPRLRRLHLLVIINVTAALIGMTAAAAAPRPSAEKAFAYHGMCTHYSHPYGQFSSSTAWESQLCHTTYDISPVAYITDGVAQRTQNRIFFCCTAKNTSLWYANENGSYHCCLSAHVGQLHVIGDSQGHYAKAVCNLPFEDPRVPGNTFNYYCNTYW
jgi:hypothetical protein